jgi:hypothetical protein
LNDDAARSSTGGLECRTWGKVIVRRGVLLHQTTDSVIIFLAKSPFKEGIKPKIEGSRLSAKSACKPNLDNIFTNKP